MIFKYYFNLSKNNLIVIFSALYILNIASIAPSKRIFKSNILFSSEQILRPELTFTFASLIQVYLYYNQ